MNSLEPKLVEDILCPLSLQLLDVAVKAALSSEALFTVLGGEPPLSTFTLRLPPEHHIIASLRTDSCHQVLREKTATLLELGALLESSLARLFSAVPLFPTTSPSHAFMQQPLWQPTSEYRAGIACSAGCCPFVASFERPLTSFDPRDRGIPIELVIDPHLTPSRDDDDWFGARPTEPNEIELHINVFHWQMLEARGIGRSILFPQLNGIMQSLHLTSFHCGRAHQLYYSWRSEMSHTPERPHVVVVSEEGQQAAPFSGLLDCILNPQSHVHGDNQGTGTGALPFAVVFKPPCVLDEQWVGVPRASYDRAMFLVQHTKRGPIIVSPTPSGRSKLGWIHDPKLMPRLSEQEILLLQDRFAMLESCRGLLNEGQLGPRAVIDHLCFSTPDTLDVGVAIGNCRKLCGEGNIPSGEHIQQWWEVSMKPASQVVSLPPTAPASVLRCAESLVRTIDTLIAINVVPLDVTFDWRVVCESFTELAGASPSTVTLGPEQFDMCWQRSLLLQQALASVPSDNARFFLQLNQAFRGLALLRYPFVLETLDERFLFQCCGSLVEMIDPFTNEIEVGSKDVWEALKQIAAHASAEAQTLDLKTELAKHLATAWKRTLATHAAAWDRVCSNLRYRRFSLELMQIIQLVLQTATRSASTTTSTTSGSL